MEQIRSELALSERQVSGAALALSTPGGPVRGWQYWAPYAAVGWSVVYAVLGAYWLATGLGFPYAPGLVSEITGPVAGRLGLGVAWAVVVAVGLPAAAVGAAMLRGVRVFRPFFIAAGALFAGALLLLETDVSLLILLGYTPYSLAEFLSGGDVGWYVEALTQWSTLHQLLCLAGGFFWLAATVSYACRSGDRCLHCGRGSGPEGWTSPASAARWGRIAVYVAVTVPVFYALTRIAYALGIPLGISEEFLRRGQESGMWTAGLFLAAFGLVGAVLTLGLVQRWGEVFPRWMIGLAGRRIPIALAVVPASIVSVLTAVGGIAMWSGLAQAVAKSVAGGTEDLGIIAAAPTALFPAWGVALAVATLAYYYRRRGPCETCGRGASSEAGDTLVREGLAVGHRTPGW